jgi:DNA-binding MarR family transcriptional regulator
MSEINKLQTNIMLFVKYWANTKKTTIPQKEIIIAMKATGVKSYTALNAINSLITKGYIRRAYSEKANRTFYVMIRNI